MIACQEEDEIEEEVINMLEESNDHQESDGRVYTSRGAKKA